MSRPLLGAGLLVVAAACGQVPSGEHVERTEATRTAKQDLIAAPEKHTGEDLGAKELALTFDDGPGPMDVSGALAEWLSKRPTPIRVTYFINGACVAKTPLSNDDTKNQSCGDPTPNADAVLAKEASFGHYIANHTTTHRDLISEVLPLGNAEVVQELTETDGLISKYLVWNRMFFRAPYGDYDTADFNALKSTAMNKYAGPIYWTAGGGPTDTTKAADWECWEVKKFTTKKCGDLYLKEIQALGNKGIVLMHDAKGDTTNHDINAGVGNTFDMVKYIVPILEADGFKFKRLDEVPTIAAVLPKCDASCADCKGPAATDCTACTPDKHVEGGKCVAGAPPVDAGTDASANADGGNGTSSSSSSTSSSSSSTSSSGSPPAEDAGAPAEAKGDDGCNASGGSGGFGSAAALAGLGLAISRRSKRRRTRKVELRVLGRAKTQG